MKWDGGSTGETVAGAIAIGMLNYSEAYLNTIVKATRWAIFPTYFGNGDNNDVRGNVAIDSGVDGAVTGNNQVASNVFYNSSALGSGTASRSLVTRANSTYYAQGTVMRRNSDCYTCTAGDDPATVSYTLPQLGALQARVRRGS